MPFGVESIKDNDVIGADEIIKALDNLNPKLSRQVLFNAHKTVLRQVVRPDLRSVLSSFSRASKSGIAIRKAKGTQSGAYIGITTNAYWLRFVNYGTADRYTKAKKITRIKTKRYHTVGRFGRTAQASRGRVTGDKRISSKLESKANEVMAEIQNNYADLVGAALNKELQRVKTKFSRL